MEMDPGNDLVIPSCPGRQFDLLYQCKAMFGDHAEVCPFRTSVRIVHMYKYIHSLISTTINVLYWANCMI